MEKEIQGSCLCGKVQFVIWGTCERFYFCHCSRCRKATGSAHASNILIKADQFRWISGEENIKKYDLETAQFFSKSFCSNCGSPVPYLSRRGNGVVVQAGLLSDDIEMKPQANIYYASKAKWYESGLMATKFEEAQK